MQWHRLSTVTPSLVAYHFVHFHHLFRFAELLLLVVCVSVFICICVNAERVKWPKTKVIKGTQRRRQWKFIGEPSAAVAMYSICYIHCYFRHRRDMWSLCIIVPYDQLPFICRRAIVSLYYMTMTTTTARINRVFHVVSNQIIYSPAFQCETAAEAVDDDDELGKLLMFRIHRSPVLKLVERVLFWPYAVHITLTNGIYITQIHFGQIRPTRRHVDGMHAEWKQKKKTGTEFIFSINLICIWLYYPNLDVVKENRPNSKQKSIRRIRSVIFIYSILCIRPMANIIIITTHPHHHCYIECAGQTHTHGTRTTFAVGSTELCYVHWCWALDAVDGNENHKDWTMR